MPQKRFDAALKHLLEKYPADVPRYVLRFLGSPPARGIEPIDTDVSTVTAAADKVYRIRGPQAWLLHLELQSSHNPRLAQQLLLYNVLLSARHRLPVHSVVLLLRRQADRGSLTGHLVQEGHCGVYLRFDYVPIRLWQEPVEPLLTGGPGLLPLAPLANVPSGRLESVVGRVAERLEVETPAEADELWAATYVLLGLQHSDTFIDQLFRGVRGMRESSTYRAIIREGKVEALQEVLLKLGIEQFGDPDAETRSVLLAIKKLGQLIEMIRALPATTNWDKLLATPPPRPRRRRRARD